MAQNKNVNNATVNNQEVAQQVVEATNEVVNAQAVAIAQDAVQQVPQVPAQPQEAQVPAEQKVPFKEKAKAFGKKAWNVVKWPLAIAGIVGVAIGAEKIGEGVGFDKATDAYDKRSGGNDPDPEDEDEDDDLGDDGIEEIE